MTDIQDFAKNLFEPDDIVEGRLIRGKKPNAQTEKLWMPAKDLPTIENELRELNEQGYNIYFGPNPRKESGKSGDSNVLLARCLFCDFDTLDDAAIAEIDKKLRLFPDPAMLVHSGHGFHVYWRLAEPILDMNLWKSLQERLNQHLGADPAIKNPERIMRMPGFLNTKLEPFVLCYILGNTGSVCSLSSFTAVLDCLPAQQQPIPKPKPALPLPKPAATSRPTDNDYAERKARAILYVAKVSGAAEGNRNAAAFKLAARLRELFNLTDDDLLDILNGWNSKNAPPLDAIEVADVVKHVGNYAKQPAGGGYVPLNIQRPACVEPSGGIVSLSMNDIQEEAVAWLWHNRIPAGELTLLVGNGSAGKTTLSSYIMAKVSSGDKFYDSRNSEGPKNVLFLGNEDSLGKQLKGKLVANLADCKRIHAVDYVKLAGDGLQHTFSIKDHLHYLVELIDKIGDVGLVVIDPITQFLGNVNENSNSEVRTVLAPLIGLVRERGITCIGISHLSKKTDISSAYRILGSIAFVAAARSVWLVAAEKNDDSTADPVRYFMPVKANYSINPSALTFRIQGRGEICFNGESDRHADDVLSGGHIARAKNDAKEWLVNFIGKETLPAADIIAAGAKKGFSSPTIHRAANELGISKLRSAGHNNRYVWSLNNGYP